MTMGKSAQEGPMLAPGAQTRPRPVGVGQETSV